MPIGTVAFCLLPFAWTAANARQQARPTFRSGVELVAIDVQVVDRDGKPIPQLTPADFDVRIDGRRRTVVSADLMTYAAGEVAGKAAPPALVKAKAPATTPGRVFVVAVDEGSLRPGDAMAARESARRFLKKLLPGDYVGVFKYPLFEKVLDLTRKHEDASRVFERVMGTYSPPRGQFHLLPSEIIDITAGDRDTLDEVERRECGSVTPGSTMMTGCRSQIAGEANMLAAYAESEGANRVLGLRLLLDALADMPDRKTLVILSGGMLSGVGVGRPDMSAMMLQLGREAAAANTSLYVLHLDNSFAEALFRPGDPMPVTPGVAPPMARMGRDGDAFAAGLERLADAASGGYIRVRAGTPDYAFDRVLRETSAYYLLAVEPEDRDRNGRLHFLRIGVKHKGATVRTKSHVFIPKKP